MTLALSKLVRLPWLPRYDLILIACLIMQYAMVRGRLETKDELKVITVFHGIGLGLELFKVQMGSWSYPEPAWAKIGGVPLYSGFMYASVASYICQAWRRFDLRLLNWPSARLTVLLCVAVYANFFLHHFLPDLRWLLMLALIPIFYRTKVCFTINRYPYRMPVVLSYLLIGFFIWIAENISTFFGAWQYPNQTTVWHPVHLGKISSWFLLVIISFIIVAHLKRIKEQRNNEPKVAA